VVQITVSATYPPSNEVGAVRQIDDPHHAENQREAAAHQEQQRAIGNPIEKPGSARNSGSLRRDPPVAENPKLDGSLHEVVETNSLFCHSGTRLSEGGATIFPPAREGGPNEVSGRRGIDCNESPPGSRSLSLRARHPPLAGGIARTRLRIS